MKLIAHGVVLFVGDPHVALLHEVGEDVHLLSQDVDSPDSGVRLNLGLNVLSPSLHELEEVTPSVHEEVNAV